MRTPSSRQNLDAHAVVALIGLEAEALVGLDRVEPFVLQLVGADLVGEADAAAFLVEIEQDAAALPRRSIRIAGVELRRRSRSGSSAARRRSGTTSGRARCTSLPSPISPRTSATWVWWSTWFSNAWTRKSPWSVGIFADATRFTSDSVCIR